MRLRLGEGADGLVVAGHGAVVVDLDLIGDEGGDDVHVDGAVFGGGLGDGLCLEEAVVAVLQVGELLFGGLGAGGEPLGFGLALVLDLLQALGGFGVGLGPLLLLAGLGLPEVDRFGWLRGLPLLLLLLFLLDLGGRGGVRFGRRLGGSGGHGWLLPFRVLPLTGQPVSGGEGG